MKKRNRFMVDHSSYCVCAQLRSLGGTVQTLKYAKQQGLTVINTTE